MAVRSCAACGSPIVGALNAQRRYCPGSCRQANADRLRQFRATETRRHLFTDLEAVFARQRARVRMRLLKMDRRIAHAHDRYGDELDDMRLVESRR